MYKYVYMCRSFFDALPQVLEMLRRRGASCEENIDAMGLLQTLCLVKMDTVDGKKSVGTAGKQPVKAADCHTGAAGNDCRTLEPPVGNDHRLDTELKGELLQETQRHRIRVHLCSFRAKALRTYDIYQMC